MTDRDIVERLHHHAGSQVPGRTDTYALLVEAAGDLERLRAENAKLRAALYPFATYGALLQGQRTRRDTALVELWDHRITGQDLIDAAEALGDD